MDRPKLKGLWVEPQTGRLYYRSKVPADVVGAIGFSWFKKALGTSDVVEALGRYQIERQAAAALIASARAGEYPPITREAAEALAWEWSTSGLMPDLPKNRIWDEKHAGELTDSLSQYLEKIGRRYRPAGPAFGLILDAARRQYLGGRSLPRLVYDGQWPMPEREEAATNPPSASPSLFRSIRLSGLLHGYVDANPQVSAQTIGEWITTFRQFMEFSGGDRDAHFVTKAEIRDYREAISLLPRAMPRAFRKMPIRTLVAMMGEIAARPEGKRSSSEQKLHDTARVTPTTVEKRITALKSVFRWGLEKDHLVADPTLTISFKRVKRGKRKPFGIDDLKAIFSGPWFTDADPDPCQRKASYWIPLLAAYGGERREELCQLLTSDVKAFGKVAYLDLVDDGDLTKSLKTEGSQRRVPLHPEVLDRGFLAYVQARRDAGDERLFPELRPKTIRTKTTEGNERLQIRFGDYWGRDFSKYLRETCGVTSSGNVFHSFRHSFKDAARECGLSKDENDALTGHVSGDVADDYGEGFSVTRLFDAISRIEYPGLKIPGAIET